MTLTLTGKIFLPITSELNAPSDEVGRGYQLEVRDTERKSTFRIQAGGKIPEDCFYNGQEHSGVYDLGVVSLGGNKPEKYNLTCLCDNEVQMEAHHSAEMDAKYKLDFSSVLSVQV